MYSFYPLIDYRVSSYYILYLYSFELNNEISSILLNKTSGELKFMDYKPDDNLELIITANNIAGSIKTKILIKICEEKLINGIKLTMKDKVRFFCYSNDTTKTYDIYEMIWDDLEGIDGTDAFDIWNIKCNNEILSHAIFWSNITYIGYINVEKEGNYTFYNKNDYSLQNKIWINNELIFDTTGHCNSWDIELTESIYLKKGNNKLFMYILATNKDEENDGFRRFRLRYSPIDSSVPAPLNLYSIYNKYY